MKYVEGFEKLGLSVRDSRVYTTLLKEGVSSIRHISENSGINRGSVYESLKNLMTAGLVSFQRANVNKKYFAEKPEKILDLIDQQKNELNELRASVREIIPDLTTAMAYMPYANIKFYEDHEGVAVILRDVLDTAERLETKEYYAMSSRPLRKYLYKKFPNFTRERIRRGVFVKVIALGEGGHEDEASARKWLETYPGVQPSSYNLIYDDKFAMIALNDSFNPYGIVIKDAGVATMQRLQFDKLWADS